MNGWPGKEREPDAVHFNFFAGGLFEVGDDLRAVAIEVEPHRNEQNRCDDNTGDDKEHTQSDFAGRSHANSRAVPGECVPVVELYPVRGMVNRSVRNTLEQKGTQARWRSPRCKPESRGTLQNLTGKEGTIYRAATRRRAIRAELS